MPTLSRMALTDTAAAIAQYVAALPWQASIASAESALDAIRYLLIARGQSTETTIEVQGMGRHGESITYSTLESEKKAIETFLGAKRPRAFGRSRRNGVSHQTGGIA